MPDLLEERGSLLVAVLEAADGRVPVVAHTGAMTTADTVRLTVHAATVGAASAMVVLPYYELLTTREVEAHLGEVAAAVGIPLMYDNLPTATGVTLSVDELGSLARRGIIASVEDTGGDGVWFDQLLGRYGDDLQVLHGGDTLTFAALAAGAPGAVWGRSQRPARTCGRALRHRRAPAGPGPWPADLGADPRAHGLPGGRGVHAAGQGRLPPGRCHHRAPACIAAVARGRRAGLVGTPVGRRGPALTVHRHPVRA